MSEPKLILESVCGITISLLMIFAVNIVSKFPIVLFLFFQSNAN